VDCLSQAAMALKISVQQLSGEVAVIEAVPATTIREFKRQLKALQRGVDELTCNMSLVEVMVDDQRLTDNDETLAEAGISEDKAVTVAFIIKPVECLCKEAAGCDEESLLVVTIPGVAVIPLEAFIDARHLVRVTIPDTVAAIGEGAFAGCISLQQASNVQLTFTLAKC